jgi:hypothetical protein
MYIELNFGSLLKSPKLTIGHLRVGKLKKNTKFIKGPTYVVTTNIPIKYISSIS